MFDNLETLARLVAVADCGTLHKAAETLGVTQPAITRSIKQLENSVGAPIFIRKGRGVELTAIGTRTVEHARNILRECALAGADVTTLRDGEAGSLRIAAAPVWLSSILPQAVAQTQLSFPNLNVSLQSLSYQEAIPLLNSGDLDVFCGGFQLREGLSSFLVRTPMFASNLNVISRATHPVLKRSRIDARELLDYPWLSYQSDVAYLDMVMEMIATETGQQRKASVHCESILTVLELLRLGDYLAFLPSSFLSSRFGADLRVVPTLPTKAQFQSGMIYRRNLRDSEPFRKLMSVSHACVKELKLRHPKKPPSGL